MSFATAYILSVFIASFVVIIIESGIMSLYDLREWWSRFRYPIAQFGLGAIFGYLLPYLHTGPPSIQVPEKADTVSIMHIKDLGLSVIFVPDEIDVKFEQPDKLEPIPDPISENRQ